MTPIHTSDIRLAKRLWRELGGELVPVSGTGELQWRHPHFVRAVRTNDRRKDVPAKVLSLINQLRRRVAPSPQRGLSRAGLPVAAVLSDTRAA